MRLLLRLSLHLDTRLAMNSMLQDPRDIKLVALATRDRVCVGHFLAIGKVSSCLRSFKNPADAPTHTGAVPGFVPACRKSPHGRQLPHRATRFVRFFSFLHKLLPELAELLLDILDCLMLDPEETMNGTLWGPLNFRSSSFSGKMG